jgi:hypothetical protein
MLEDSHTAHLRRTVKALQEAYLAQVRLALAGLVPADALSVGAKGWLRALEAHPNLREIVLRQDEFPEEYWVVQGSNPVLHVFLHATAVAESESAEVVRRLRDHAAQFQASEDAAEHVAVHVHGLLASGAVWTELHNQSRWRSRWRTNCADYLELAAQNRIGKLPSAFRQILKAPPLHPPEWQ